MCREMQENRDLQDQWDQLGIRGSQDLMVFKDLLGLKDKL